jgi:hypothetical protein
MDLRLESLLVCYINMRGRTRGAHTHTHHHVKTLAATSSQPNPKILATCELAAHPHMVFHLCTCGLRGCATAVAATLISNGGARSLLSRGRGGGDQLLLLHRHMTTLDRCSNSSSTVMHI